MRERLEACRLAGLQAWTSWGAIPWDARETGRGAVPFDAPVPRRLQARDGSRPERAASRSRCSQPSVGDGPWPSRSARSPALRRQTACLPSASRSARLPIGHHGCADSQISPRFTAGLSDCRRRLCGAAGLALRSRLAPSDHGLLCSARAPVTSRRPSPPITHRPRCDSGWKLELWCRCNPPPAIDSQCALLGAGWSMERPVSGPAHPARDAPQVQCWPSAAVKTLLHGGDPPWMMHQSGLPRRQQPILIHRAACSRSNNRQNSHVCPPALPTRPPPIAMTVSFFRASGDCAPASQFRRALPRVARKVHPFAVGLWSSMIVSSVQLLRSLRSARVISPLPANARPCSSS
ncbi:hypothetical protein BDV95DRAFT_596292 [Massariosphaeria phaeospora]|uniref:Uncharacterized protein n=1 Tax=Massariosphaeria phaeospora TaxID=100035 RepID=A0A7C8M733_9PLEO|nr:hypothetical protein BDV95DRAFT_596292 [Massariosphaeria phaeospora]